MERSGREAEHDAKGPGRPDKRDAPVPDAPQRIDTRADVDAGLVPVDGPVIGDRDGFMARLREMSSSMAVEMLGERAQGCPYIEAWFARHQGTDAQMLERMARRYGGMPGATTEDALLAALRARLRMGIAYWQSGEDVSGELALAGLVETSRAVAGHDAIAGAVAGDEVQAARVAAELGDGQPLAGGARLHTDATAARLADRAEAHAFTIGRDVVLGANAPRPGTLAGDALLAHELAHVQQQAAPGTAAPGTGERDADLAAIGAVAARLGMVLPLGRAIAGTRLSLQRCKGRSEKKADEGSGSAAATTDAGTADAAAVDAAVAAAPLPPGKRSWVKSQLVTATTSGLVRGDKVPTVDAAAEQFGWNKTYVGQLITLYAKSINPDFNENRIGPRTTFNVPSAIETPQPAELLPDDVDAAGSVAFETWSVEQHPVSAAAGRTPYVPKRKGGRPDPNSGVTLGHGYDMKARSPDTIEADLLAAGVPAALATKYRGASKLKGQRAKDWIDKNAPWDAIGEAQDKLLFRNEYRETTDAVASFIAARTLTGSDDRGYKQDGDKLRLQIDLEHMHPTILALVVDLRFRGDLGDTSWGYIHDAVKANDLAALQAKIKDAAMYKQKIDNNYNRYAARCRLVGATPVTEPVFDAA